MFSKLVLVISSLILVAGCSTVTIHPKPTQKFESNPTYEDSKSFYMWGLVGDQRVDVQEVCNGKEVAQMQSQQTFANGFLTIITLGIYAPHSVKVWCK